MGRIVGLLKKAAAPVGFTALSYGIGKLSGQSDAEALATAGLGVAGSYAGEYAGRKATPFHFNVPVKGQKIPISPTGIVGSLAGSGLGVSVAESAYNMANPQKDGQTDQGEVHPALYALDELSLPLYQIARAAL